MSIDFLRLPTEIQLVVASYLDGQSLLHLSRTCKALQWLRTDRLWKSAALQHGFEPLDEAKEVPDGDWRRFWIKSWRQTTLTLLNSEADFDDICDVLRGVFAGVGEAEAAAIALGVHFNSRLVIFRGQPSECLALRRHARRVAERIDWRVETSASGPPFVVNIVVPTEAFRSETFRTYLSTKDGVFTGLQEMVAVDEMFDWMSMSPESIIIAQMAPAASRALLEDVNKQLESTPHKAYLIDVRAFRPVA